MWNKQLYRYPIAEWLDGDPDFPPSAQRRELGARNVNRTHLDLADVISMPDEWEYPWFASWDLAFHAVAFAHIDPDFAKRQLELMCAEWPSTRTANCPRTNGTSRTSTRRCTPGAGRFAASTAAATTRSCCAPLGTRE